MSEHLISFEEAQGDLLAAAAYLAENIKSGDGFAEAMKTIVPLYLERGNVDLAAELSNTIDDPFTRDKLLILVAEKCAELGDDEYALQLADAIEDQGIQSQAREKISIQKAHAGEFVKAHEIAETILHTDYAFAEIAVGQAKHGLNQDSSASFRKIEMPAANASAHMELAAWSLGEGKIEQAVTELDSALSVANEIEHDEERLRMLVDIGNAFIQAEKNDSAIRTFETARDLSEGLSNAHRDFFLAGAAIGLLQAGNLDAADSTLDLVTDKTQVASGLLGFAREFWKNGEKTEAMEALEESYSITRSQRENEIRDSRAANGLYGMIAVQFAHFGKAERSIEVAQENRDDNENMSALARIAQVFAMEDNDEASAQAVRAISDDANRIFALIGVADAKQKVGQNESALQSLGEALSLAETIPQLAPRSLALNEITSRFMDMGNTAKAAEAANESLQTLAAIRDESSQAVALAQFAETIERCVMELGDGEKLIVRSLIKKSEM